jgi:hypothetical protein
MWAFGLLLGAGAFDPPLEWVRVLAWIAFIPGIILSYMAAVDYARTVLVSLRAERGSAQAG